MTFIIMLILAISLYLMPVILSATYINAIKSEKSTIKYNGTENDEILEWMAVVFPFVNFYIMLLWIFKYPYKKRP